MHLNSLVLVAVVSQELALVGLIYVENLVSAKRALEEELAEALLS